MCRGILVALSFLSTACTVNTDKADATTSGPDPDTGTGAVGEYDGVQGYSASCDGFDARDTTDELYGVAEPDTDTDISWHCWTSCYLGDGLVPFGGVPVKTLLYASNAHREMSLYDAVYEVPSTGVIQLGTVSLEQTDVHVTNPNDAEAESWDLDPSTLIATSDGVTHANLPIDSVTATIHVNPPLNEGDLYFYENHYSDPTDDDARQEICNTLSPEAGGDPWGYVYIDVYDNDGSGEGEASSSDATISNVDCTGEDSASTVFTALPLTGARQMNLTEDTVRLRLSLIPASGRIDYAGRRITNIHLEGGDLSDFLLAYNGEVYELTADWEPPTHMRLEGNLAIYAASPDTVMAWPQLTVTGSCESLDPSQDTTQNGTTATLRRYALSAAGLELLGVPEGVLHSSLELNVLYDEGSASRPASLSFELPWLETRSVVLDNEAGSFRTTHFRRGMDLDVTGEVGEVTESSMALTINGTSLTLPRRD